MPAAVRSRSGSQKRRNRSDGLWTRSHPLSSLEADVLQDVGGLAIQLRGRAVVSTTRGKIALCDPRLGSMTPGRHLVVRPLAGVDCLRGLVETILLEQRAAEHELRVADLVQLVFA